MNSPINKVPLNNSSTNLNLDKINKVIRTQMELMLDQILAKNGQERDFFEQAEITLGLKAKPEPKAKEDLGTTETENPTETAEILEESIISTTPEETTKEPTATLEAVSENGAEA